MVIVNGTKKDKILALDTSIIGTVRLNLVLQTVDSMRTILSKE